MREKIIKELLANIPDVLAFAHLTLGCGFIEILKSDANPAFFGEHLVETTFQTTTYQTPCPLDTGSLIR